MKITTKDMTQVALMAAILCVVSPLSIPLPTGVPITLSILVIFLTGIILGWRKAVLAIAIYIIIGAIGLPVFSGYSGGLEKLAGATGGYIIGYLFCGFFTGLFAQKIKNPFLIFLGMIIGYVLCIGLGTIWLARVMSLDFKAALMAGVIPFLIGDVIKMIVAEALGLTIKKILVKGNIL